MLVSELKPILNSLPSNKYKFHGHGVAFKRSEHIKGKNTLT